MRRWCVIGCWMFLAVLAPRPVSAQLCEPVSPLRIGAQLAGGALGGAASVASGAALIGAAKVSRNEFLGWMSILSVMSTVGTVPAGAALAGHMLGCRSTTTGHAIGAGAAIGWVAGLAIMFGGPRFGLTEERALLIGMVSVLPVALVSSIIIYAAGLEPQTNTAPTAEPPGAAPVGMGWSLSF